ncbi:MAG: lipopolysaccharide transport system permease protein [Chloroflexota bacterium]|jgi:ABC-type polysaccharide/polyol phosphate export permease|nr:lipopolysaccharide transport system permease protein [Chloroflexota bacterium]
MAAGTEAVNTAPVEHEDAGFQPHSRTITLTSKPLPLMSVVKDLWAARYVLWTLGRQEFFSRYRRASLGVIWAVALPLLQAAVLAVVFSQIVRFRTGQHFVVFVLGGLTVWSFFGGTLSTSATAIVDGAGMASKIYFPRAVLPMIKLVASSYSLCISVALLVAVTLISGIGLHPSMLLLLPAALLLIALTLAISLVSSALHVYFRDIRFAVSAVLTIWFYATPIIYPVELISGPVKTLLWLNPVTAIVEMVREATVGADPGWEVSLISCVTCIVVLMFAAMILHRRFDRVFSDRL